MTIAADFDAEASEKSTVAGHTPKHPIPNIRQYHERQKEREQVASAQEDLSSSTGSQEPKSSFLESAKERLGVESPSNRVFSKSPYKSSNRNVRSDDKKEERESSHGSEREASEDDRVEHPGEGLESANAATNPRRKRKNMKHMKPDTKGREVTDPVTHLKVFIHDQTEKDLRRLSDNEDPQDCLPLNDQVQEMQRAHTSMEKLFPPPEFQHIESQIAHTMQRGLTTLEGRHHKVFTIIALLIMALIVYLTTRSIMSKQISSIWEGEVWSSERRAGDTTTQSIPESTQWLNSILNSVWSLINPDLFTSLADTLEDVMQASLPKMVRMISVEDLGQGNEAIRILGVKFLPAGAASKDVSVDGMVERSRGKGDAGPVSSEEKVSIKKDPNVDEGQKPSRQQTDDKGDNDDDSTTGNEDGAGTMDAEQGDFVNVELGFAYRASSNKGNNLKSRAKNAHLYLAFYLPGGIRFPVWVELRGIVGIMRMRLQLCPDPPFFSLCTLTLLGQPKAEMSCVPLTKKGLNIMDLPLISSFVQSAIDAALAEYVAPKSLTLDLKEMLMGDDFKKDTMYQGVLVVRIKRGKDFKEGDPGFAGLAKGSTDGYVTVGWAKYGKPIWSTRVIVGDMSPCWEETGFVLVGPEELNADERLRVQLWDSDRSSADDDLGKIEVDLKELMHNSQCAGRMWERDDGFGGMSADENMPGSLEWSIGYFAKTRIQELQLERQELEPEVNTERQLKEKVSDDVEQKMREAGSRYESSETNQQKAQDLKAREDEMIISVAPSQEFPTGILSVQVHNITGLEFEKLNKDDRAEGDDTDGVADDLPSAYCTIILNHQKIFKTRTKPKNSKPFFNAGTERVIRDWRTTEVMISVRDSRVHEDDPLLGIVYLPLNKLFKHRSQLVDAYPLMSGIGYGRIRISMVFRSINFQAARQLLGWDYGTLEITKPIETQDLASDLQKLRLKLRTSVSHCKMYTSSKAGSNSWTGKKERPVRLAVRKRYASCLVLEFRKHRAGPDVSPAFAVLWLKDVPDDEESLMTLPVWRSDGENLKKAGSSNLEHLGEKAGSLTISLKFWRGMSDYHRKLASKNPSLGDVLEILDVANDNREIRKMIADQTSDSDTSDSDDEHNPIKELSNKVQSFGTRDSDEDKDGKRGPIDQIRDYNDHSKQLHRQNRGMMQHKAPRTAKYLKTKFQHGKDHLMDSFKHHDREPDVETEV